MNAPLPAAAPAADTVSPAAESRVQFARHIWALAWPVIATFSLESLVGLVDMLMVGRLGANAVAAVGVGTQILGAVGVAMTAVGTGTVALVARAVGAGRVRDAEEVELQSIYAAAVLSVVAILPVWVWAPAVVRAFGVAPDVVDLGVRFVRCVLFAIPPGAVMFVVASGLRGAGDTRTPLAIGIAVNVINVGVGYVLIFGKLGLPALGVVGSGVGTVVAFVTGAVLGTTLLARGGLRLRIRRARPHVGIIRRVLAIGYPSGVEQLLIQIGFLIYVVFAARYGTSAVAAYFIGVKILALSFLPGFGFSAAAATLVGQNLGARRPQRAARSGWEATRLAVLVMTTAGVVIFVAARPIARAFVDDPEVVADAVAFIRMLAAVQPLMAIDFTLGGALRGAGDTRFPLVAVLIAFYGCRLGFAWVVTHVLDLGLLWLWGAILGDYVMRVALKGWRFRSGRWQHIAL